MASSPCPPASCFLSGFQRHHACSCDFCHDRMSYFSPNACSFMSHGLSLNCFCIAFLQNNTHSFTCIGLCHFKMITKHLGIRIAILTSGHGPCPHLGPLAESQGWGLFCLSVDSVYTEPAEGHLMSKEPTLSAYVTNLLLHY